VLLAVITVLWFALRMPETLAPENRAPFSLRQIAMAVREIVSIRLALGFTVTAGLINGAFLGYLNSAQQIFQEQYALGERFPLYFAVAAFSIGLASLLNARLVMRLGMSLLARWSLFAVWGLSIVALVIALLTAGQPPLWFLMAYLTTAFFCIGILFGNINALAMKPLGHIAGIGAAVVGSLSTLISVPIGTVVGQSYNGTILPFVGGMVILVGLSIVVVRWAEN
jgi:DHA1 family bicyclomycin/chloramphenicol resistance-like MFS transporter